MSINWKIGDDLDAYEASVVHRNAITPPEEESTAPSSREGAEGSEGEGGGKGAPSWTSGPWDFDRETWHENTPGEQEKQGLLVVFPVNEEGEGHGMTIARLCEWHDDKETARANAHLIATAPDLYEALGDLVALAESAMRGANRGGGEYDAGAELADARAILARARGEGS